MNILSDVYKRIIHCPPVPPETGGIIGIKDEVVCDFLFDRGSPEGNRAVYTPNIEWLNAKIQQWKECGVLFSGIVHSHPINQPKLSSDDIEYIHRIFQALPISMDCLFFPIVLPGVKMIPFKAFRCDGNINIYEDKIIFVKGALNMNIENKEKEIKIPCGMFCGHNCADGCIYWNPYDKDSNGRQYCSWYRSYYYPRERQGCLSYKG